MKYPTTRFVFDRKKTATEKKDALIQIEVLLESKKKYITTGVRVYKGQWSPKTHVTGRDDMITLNERIESLKKHIDEYITSLIKERKAFDWYEFERFLIREDARKETFIDFLYRRIEERTDLRDSTKKAHRKLIGSLQEFGRIDTFSDLTRPNIKAYYEYLLGRDVIKIGKDGKEYATKMATQTVASYMKVLRTYIHDAIVQEKIDKDPSMGIKVKRGDYEQTRWLTEDEIGKIETAEMPNGSLTRVRDLFVFSCYSGLAFSDLMDFRPDKIEKEGENMYMYGKRIKTGQEYIVLILPKAKEILEKYDYKLPKYSNQQYNHRLKDVAEAAGVDKPISSHWSRISFGFLALNSGVRIEVVSKAMGHSTINETQRTYSRILKKTVVSEMGKMLK